MRGYIKAVILNPGHTVVCRTFKKYWCLSLKKLNQNLWEWEESMAFIFFFFFLKLITWYRPTHFIVLCFIVLCRYHKLKVYGNPVLSKSSQHHFPVTIVHFASLSHFDNSCSISIFFIAVIFVMVISDLWCCYYLRCHGQHPDRQWT